MNFTDDSTGRELEFSPQAKFAESAGDERLRIENLGLRQDIRLKSATLGQLFFFLKIETIAIFLIAFLQAFGLWRFHLDEWGFRLIISATLLQITYMLQVAVKHLFPAKP